MGRQSKMTAGIVHSAAAMWNRLPAFHAGAASKRIGSSLFHASAASAATTAWKAACSSSTYPFLPRRPVPQRIGCSSFHASAAAASKAACSPSSYPHLCRCPVLPSVGLHDAQGNLPLHRNVSTNWKKCCCMETLPDSQIEGFMYEDYDPPEQIDWRKLGVVTPVKDQLVDGVCWAYAATGAVESINAIKTGKLLTLSEQQLIDCNNLSNGGYSGGHAHIAFDYVVRNGGMVEERLYPAAMKQCPCRKISSQMITIDGYQFVPRNNEFALLQAAANQPVVVDICMNEKLMAYKGGIAYDDGVRGELNHSVLLVSFGQTKKGEKFWIVKDSAGRNARKKGYILIGRGTGRPGGEFGILEFPCFPVKTSPNCEGFVDDDLSLYSNLYGGESVQPNEELSDYCNEFTDHYIFQVSQINDTNWCGV